MKNTGSTRRQQKAWLSLILILGCLLECTEASETNTSGSLETKPTIQTRIIGGTNAAINEFPWFAATAGNVMCGASLIHKDIVLTAAHCLEAFPIGSGIFIGSTVYGSPSGNARYRTVKATRIHPAYDPEKYGNDFLLLKLNQTVSITPVLLNDDPTFPPVGETLTVMGFGLTSESGSQSTNLRKVDVYSVDQELCRWIYYYQAEEDIIDDNVMMCAGLTFGGKDSCGGDSGGPLVSADGIQVGIVSFGLGCARRGIPSVYARVSGVIDWIRTEICRISSQPPRSCRVLGYPTPSPIMRIDESDSVAATLQPTDIPTSLPTYYPSADVFDYQISDVPSNIPSDIPSVVPSGSRISPATEDKIDMKYVEVIIRISYNFDVDGISWTLSHNDEIISFGPEYQPKPYEVKEYTQSLHPGMYSFTIFNSFCTGLHSPMREGYFEVWSLDNNTVLAKGDHNFDCSSTVVFEVSSDLE